MNRNRSRAVGALIAAGLLWGTTVPLSKVALAWLPPAWLTFARFGVACAILPAVSRRSLKDALRPAVLASGAIGYGGSVLLQNAGITRTSVSHAALLIGAVPVLVAIMSALWHRAVARPLAWAGFAVSLAGVGLVTAAHAGGTGQGGGAVAGDGLVMASAVLSAALMVAQPRLLRGRDPVAVTAVQFLGAAVGVLPVAACSGGMPAIAAGSMPATLAVLALAVAGTLAPFTLFAYGQKGVPAEVAGAFVNIEPVVGAVAGVVAFGDPAGPAQVAGGLAILAGIAMSSWRALAWPGRGRGLLPGARRPRQHGPQLLEVHGQAEVAVADDQLADRHGTVADDLPFMPDPGWHGASPLRRRQLAICLLELDGRRLDRLAAAVTGCSPRRCRRPGRDARPRRSRTQVPLDPHLIRLR